MQPILHGFLLALGLILPLGAQNVFVFNQGTNHKKLTGALPVIITAGLADTFLILMAVLGVSLILISLPALQLVIYIIGFVFLIYMAWSLWHEKPTHLEEQQSMSGKKQVGFALSVSLFNPHALIDTIGVIGTSATVYDGGDKVLFTASTIIVSWLWFIMLAIVGRVVGYIDKTGKYILILNKFSSIIVLIVSLVILKNIIELIFL
ncbi:LysE/ArgO family amino acid transporter [Jeotgalicoccus marinus]|uniref:LysE/ArgO family amino acid transporter n=1 Tax=Jeotgalicoccus marinus TaxID=516700 RepID=UPI000426CB2C|nr:LysE family transporter [Jeotgalicoccus marinus]